MLRPQTEDLAFRLFVANYLHQYNLQAKSQSRTVTGVEIENVTDRLHGEYAEGNILLGKMESGLGEAARTLLNRLNPNEPPDDLIEFQIDSQIVVVPAWYRCYDTAKAVIRMYRAVTHQPPL